MKIKVLRYAQEMINGQLTILDTRSIIDVNDSDALRIIKNGVAESIAKVAAPKKGVAIEAENKMVNVLYKKRGRSRKEA